VPGSLGLVHRTWCVVLYVIMKSITEKLNFIRSIFGEYSLSRGGTDAAVRCPSCKAAPGKRKLSIRLDNDFYHCWVCGIKGRNLASLLRKFARPETVTAYERDFLGVESTGTSSDEVEKIFLPKDFMLIMNAVEKTDDPDFIACLNYLKRRGLSERDIWFFKVGVSNQMNYRRRVIIPSFDADGNLNFLVSRSVDDHVIPKYLNCNVDRNSIIFNELNVDWRKPIIIVEGPFDMIKAGHNAVPLLGSGLAYESRLFKAIAKKQPTVYLALDKDASRKSQIIAKNIAAFGCPVFKVSIGDYNDVGEMTHAEFTARLQDAIPWSGWSQVSEKISSVTSNSIL